MQASINSLQQSAKKLSEAQLVEVQDLIKKTNLQQASHCQRLLTEWIKVLKEAKAPSNGETVNPSPVKENKNSETELTKQELQKLDSLLLLTNLQQADFFVFYLDNWKVCLEELTQAAEKVEKERAEIDFQAQQEARKDSFNKTYPQCGRLLSQLNEWAVYKEDDKFAQDVFQDFIVKMRETVGYFEKEAKRMSATDMVCFKEKVRELESYREGIFHGINQLLHTSDQSVAKTLLPKITALMMVAVGPVSSVTGKPMVLLPPKRKGITMPEQVASTKRLMNGHS